MPIEFVPRVYQERLIGDLVDDPRHGGLADPGLGKSAAQLLALQEARALPALLIAPLRVCYGTWPAEVAKWANFAHLRTSILHGKKRQKERALAEPADLYLINPEGLPWLLGHPNETRRKWLPGPWKDWAARPETLVVDESTRFKRASGQRSKTLKRFLGDFERRHILTGTPTPNGLHDLHGQLLILDQGESLGVTVGEFRRRWFDGVQLPGRSRRMKWEPRDYAFDQIVEAIRPRTTSLREADWLDLPEMVKTNVPVRMPDAARRIDDELKRHGTIEAWTQVYGSEVAQGKRRQIASGAVHLDDGSLRQVHPAKTIALGELLDEIAAPTIVVYEFRHELDRIRHLLRGRRVGIIAGGTSAADGVAVAEAWNRGELDYLITHPGAGGVGLNLQGGGHHMVWFTPPWNYYHYDQMIRRLHRLGQPFPVMVYHLIAEGSVDSAVGGVLVAKGADQDMLMDALKEETER